jgi:hypothetical protein
MIELALTRVQKRPTNASPWGGASAERISAVRIDWIHAIEKYYRVQELNGAQPER